MFLVAIIDWYSRNVRLWRVSNTLDASFCTDALEDALEQYGFSQIFNMDHGSELTSEYFAGALKRGHLQISMDGKGRWIDNVFVESIKYEEICLRTYDRINGPRASLGRYFDFYHTERRHQSLDRRTPDSVYYESAVRLAA